MAGLLMGADEAELDRRCGTRSRWSGPRGPTRRVVKALRPALDRRNSDRRGPWSPVPRLRASTDHAPGTCCPATTQVISWPARELIGRNRSSRRPAALARGCRGRRVGRSTGGRRRCGRPFLADMLITCTLGKGRYAAVEPKRRADGPKRAIRGRIRAARDSRKPESARSAAGSARISPICRSGELSGNFRFGRQPRRSSKARGAANPTDRPVAEQPFRTSLSRGTGPVATRSRGRPLPFRRAARPRPRPDAESGADSDASPGEPRRAVMASRSESGSWKTTMLPRAGPASQVGSRSSQSPGARAGSMRSSATATSPGCRHRARRHAVGKGSGHSLAGGSGHSLAGGSGPLPVELGQSPSTRTGRSTRGALFRPLLRPPAGRGTPEGCPPASLHVAVARWRSIGHSWSTRRCRELLTAALSSAGAAASTFCLFLSTRA